ncbi:ribulokinase [Nocardia sp. BMG111209]|uniref:ribulokinase n=1 Tax=Nocardia sp. BMG111209 TaxID=1160137 RepID=UPI00036A01C4|nr:ribulokinase [Nocardia sp. BMG111209]
METGYCTVGVDFGTLSGRAVVVRVADGTEIASATHEYRHGVLERTLPDGTPLGDGWALQAPGDWIDVLRTAVPEAVAAAGVPADRIVGIGADFTSCTILPATADGTPLADLLPGRPHAWPKLWKHHAAQRQADRITDLAAERGEKWLSRYGGRISAEWAVAKALQILEEDPALYAAADRWIEAADWIVWQLTGVETRNVATAGYKAIRQDGDYPSRDYLAALHPGFADLTGKLGPQVSALGSRAGSLTARAAAWTGLRAGTAVAVGNIDAHVTAAAADAVAPGRMVAIMGTSTCHVMPSDRLADVPGMCGVVADGIVAGLWGYEAGQSGVGDIFAWFTENCVPAADHAAAAERGLGIHEYLTERAAAQPVGGHGLIALDWNNGNRSILVDHDLSGLLIGQTLATRPEDIYRALIEATAFGARLIVETFDAAGVPVEEFIVAGGLTRNTFLMRTYADILGRPLSVIASGQGPALGSAIHAAVAAGHHPDIPTAAAAMGRRHRDAYRPDPARARAYDDLYRLYRELHDRFADGRLMHRLRDIRVAAARGAGGSGPDRVPPLDPGPIG